MIVGKNKITGKDGYSNGLSLHKIINVAKTEYVKWIYNPRMILFMMLIVFMYDYIIEEMLKSADKMDKMLMVFEPFIAMANSQLLIMVIPAVFIVLISDFPKTDGNTMFYISRVGKNNWMFGQLMFGIMAAATYILGIVFMSVTMVAKHAYGKNMWSEVVTGYVRAFPNESRSRIPMLINGRLYNNMKPFQAMVLTVSLLMLYLICMELMLLVGFSVGKRMIGILTGYVVIGIGSSLCGLGSNTQWAFPSAHSIAWLHYDEILKIQKVKITYSYAYFLLIIAVLFIVSILTVNRYDFAKITDMED